MTRSLLISVRLHDGRYHGSGDWPPSPARLFQALVAAAASDGLKHEHRKALRWLEERPVAPIIAIPVARAGQALGNFVPNNDLDAVGGDVKRIGSIRTRKPIRPWLFDATTPFLYAWSFDQYSESEFSAGVVCRMAESLYQFGRGVDMAWAVAEIIDASELERRLARHNGPIHRPCSGGNVLALPCPEPGSLASLEQRYAAARKRFTTVVSDGKARQLFTQAPKPRFRAVAYDSPTAKLLFDLRRTSAPGAPLVAWPLTRAAELVRIVRGNDGEDGLATSGVFKLLADTLPDQVASLRCVLIGRDASEADKRLRPHILPLPSTGHVHTERSIRRVLVEVPPNCPLRLDDLAWALSGLVITETLDTDSGELLQTRLVPADDRKMLDHYGVTETHAARIWRSVTPLALPQTAARRRINPSRLREEAKGGTERQAEQSRAATAVLQALRHAEIKATVSSLRVQREPFSAKGARAEEFAPGTRFAKERLWHAEISFTELVTGPLVLGDGRYAGLGLFEPVRPSSGEGVFAFSIIEGLSALAQPSELCRPLRRALMSRVQAQIDNPRSGLPMFFTGHEPDGKPARRGGHSHLAFVADLPRNRLLIVAPHLFEHRPPTNEEIGHIQLMQRAVSGLTELRAGTSGRLRLNPGDWLDRASDPFLAPSITWASQTSYAPTRHIKHISPEEALEIDIRLEIQRRRLPAPTRVEISRADVGPKRGIIGELKIQFAVVVAGPILLGRSAHMGGGMFASVKSNHST